MLEACRSPPSFATGMKTLGRPALMSSPSRRSRLWFILNCGLAAIAVIGVAAIQTIYWRADSTLRRIAHGDIDGIQAMTRPQLQEEVLDRARTCVELARSNVHSRTVFCLVLLSVAAVNAYAFFRIDREGSAGTEKSRTT